jgi:N6-L-threonylcarbamoyladenine synthase
VTASRLLLAIETSCDETAAAVVDDALVVRSSVVASQIDLHAAFGGVVPELASRAHTETITAVVARALEEAGVAGPDLGAVAVTSGPGLVGALLVGIATAKALALGWGVPVVAVNHLEGHLASVYLAGEDVPFPQTALLVSGGHCMLTRATAPGTYELLGETLDDSVGEAYDKVARFLGLGYPGGPVLDRMAAQGEDTLGFPRPMLAEGYVFSFSGLKTAVVNHVRGGQPGVAGAGPGPGRRVRHAAADSAPGDGHRQRRHDRCGRLAEAGRFGPERSGLRARARPAAAVRLRAAYAPARL